VEFDHAVAAEKVDSEALLDGQDEGRADDELEAPPQEQINP